jgi:hypothetical protein
VNSKLLLVCLLLSHYRYVLPNNLLFILATQPPADVTSLKNTIKRTSSLLQNRLPELLTAIREGVISGLSANPALDTQMSFSKLQAAGANGVQITKVVDSGIVFLCYLANA